MWVALALGSGSAGPQWLWQTELLCVAGTRTGGLNMAYQRTMGRRGDVGELVEPGDLSLKPTPL
jgi:hypothetical protein